MNRTTLYKFIFLFLSSGLLTNVSAQIDLKLNVQNLSSSAGTLLVGMYSPTDEFLADNKCSVCEAIKIKKNQQVYTIKNVPPGEYGIAILHDENDNGEMDFNWLGIPKEGYGFSNNPRSKMRQPTYDEAKVMLTKPQEITIKMTNW